MLRRFNKLLLTGLKNVLIINKSILITLLKTL